MWTIIINLNIYFPKEKCCYIEWLKSSETLCPVNSLMATFGRLNSLLDVEDDGTRSVALETIYR
jgi:hypothetical protein